MTKRAFAGPKMIMLAFGLDFVAVGFFFYSFGVFFNALIAELDASRTGLSFAITCYQITAACGAPFLGRAMDRYSLSMIISTGILFMGLGLVLISQITALWQLYLILATVLSLGASAMGNLATAKLVTNWYHAKRGAMLGIASMGVSASGLLMPLITARMLQDFEWRTVFVVYGLFLWILALPLAYRFVVGKPADIDQEPYGAMDHATNDDPKDFQPFRDQRFWGVALAFALLLCGVAAVLTHLVPMMVDLGFSLKQAAPMLSVTAGTAILGKYILGTICDRVGPHRAVAVAILAQSTGLFLLRDVSTYHEALTAVFFFGLGMGGVLPLQGALVGNIFGSRRFGTVMGLMRPVMLPLGAAGVPFAGWVFDTYGTYGPAFNVFLIGHLCAGLLLYGLSGRHKRRS